MARITFRNAADIPYDNTTSGLTGDDVQEALDEIVSETGIGSLAADSVVVTDGSGNMVTDADILFTGTTLTVGVTGTGIIKAASGQTLNIQRGDGTVWVSVISGGTPAIQTNTRVIDNIAFTMGTSDRAQWRWETGQTNDALLLAMAVGSASASGNLVLTAFANRFTDHGYTTTPDVRLILANTAAPTTDFLSFTHNGTGGLINASDRLELQTGGTSRWRVISTGAFIPHVGDTYDIGTTSAQVRSVFTGIIRAGTGNTMEIRRQDGTAWATLDNATSSTDIGIGTRFLDDIGLDFGSSNDVRFLWSTAQTNDALLVPLQVGTAAQSGNFIITAWANRALNHAYGTSADPRLIIASTTTPASNFLSLHHDGADTRFVTGSGAIILTPSNGTVRATSANTVSLGASGLAWANVYTRNLEADNGQALTINRQDAVAWATLDSGTGQTVISGMRTDFASNARMLDNINMQFGSSGDVSIQWDLAETNDALKISTGVGSADQSGNIIITETSNLDVDHGYATSADPRLYLVATTDTADFLSLHHDGSAARIITGNSTAITINTGSNAWRFNASSGSFDCVTTNARDIGSTSIALRSVFTRNVQPDTSQSLTITRQDGTVWATTGAATQPTTLSIITRMADDISLRFGDNDDVIMEMDDAIETNATFKIGLVLNSSNASGNLAIHNAANIGDNYGTVLVTNPTLKIYSATAAATATNQWISFVHDDTNGVIDTGIGSLNLRSGGTGQVQIQPRNVTVMQVAATTGGGAAVTITHRVNTSGSPTTLLVTAGAHTTLTASTEAISVDIDTSATVQFATGALATQRATVFRAPTYGFVAASTLTTAATVAITGAPIAGTNATITNSFALDVTGDVNITGKLNVSGAIDPTTLVLTEQSSVPQAPVAGELALWAKDDAPNVLMITDDAGTDFNVTISAAAFTATRIPFADSNGNLADDAGLTFIGGVAPRLTVTTGDVGVIRLESTRSSSSWVVGVDTIGELQFFGNDGSGGGANVYGFMELVTESTAGNVWSLAFGTSSNNAAAVEHWRITSLGNWQAASGTAGVIARQDGTAWATMNNGTGVTTIGISTQFSDDIETRWGASDFVMEWNTVNQTNDGIIFSTTVGSSTASGNIIFTASANRSIDHLYAINADPRLYVASTTDPANNHVSLYHDGTNGFFDTTESLDITVADNVRFRLNQSNSYGRIQLRNGATTGFNIQRISGSGPWEMGVEINESLVLVTNSTTAITIDTSQGVAVAQFLNVGTATDANAQGEVAIGLIGGSRVLVDPTNDQVVFFGPNTTNDTDQLSLRFADASNTTGVAQITGHRGSSFENGDLIFSTMQAASMTPVIRLTQDGRVGINEEAPAIRFVITDSVDNSATAVNANTTGLMVSNDANTVGSYAILLLDVGADHITDGVFVRANQRANNQVDMEFGEYNNGGSLPGTVYMTMVNGTGAFIIDGGTAPALTVAGDVTVTNGEIVMTNTRSITWGGATEKISASQSTGVMDIDAVISVDITTPVVNLSAGLQVGDLTSGRVTFATTSGRLADDDAFLWDSTNEQFTVGNDSFFDVWNRDAAGITTVFGLNRNSRTGAMGDGSSVGLTIVGRTSSVGFELYNSAGAVLQRWRFTGTAFHPVTTNVFDIGTAALAVRSTFTNNVEAGTATSLSLNVDAATQWQVLTSSNHLVPVAGATRDFGIASQPVRRVISNALRPGTTTALTIERQDGTAWATTDAGTGVTVIGIDTQFSDNITLGFGGSADVLIDWSTAQTNDGLVIATGVGTAAQSGNIIVTALANTDFDHAHAAATNPTFIVHSAAASTTQFISMAHNQVNAVIATGVGDIILDPAGNNVLPGTNIADNLGAAGLAWIRVFTRNILTDVAAADLTFSIFKTVIMTQSVQATGSPTALLVTGAAHTTLTLSAEATDIHFDLARTVQFSTGALALQRAMLVDAPTYGFVAASVLTHAATVYIDGNPIAGTNATITDSDALCLANGGRFGMEGSTSGWIRHIAAATTTDYTLIWPNADASGSQVLQSDGSGNLSWVTAGAGGNVSNTGTPLNNQVAIWTDATTVEGDADLTFNGLELTIGNPSAARANLDSRALLLRDQGDSTLGAFISLRHDNAGTAAVGDTVGRLEGQGQDVATSGTLRTYGRMDFKIGAFGAGAQDGVITIEPTIANVETEFVRFDGVFVETVFNDGSADIDFRIEGESLTYLFFTEADTASENIAMVAPGPPGWGSMIRGIFIGNVNTAPTSNPTNGGFMYVVNGALTWRGSSSTITTIAAADPHCPRCGMDYVLEWRNDTYKRKHMAVCWNCLAGALADAGISEDKYIFERSV